MTDYSFTSFSMILFSLIASIYLFNGAFFRYKTHLTLFISTCILISVSWNFIINSSFIISFTHLYTSIMSFPLFSLFLILIISFIGVAMLLSWINIASPYIIIITSSFVLTSIIAELLDSTHFTILIIIYSILITIITLLYKIKTYQLLIISSVISGAIVLSTLFAKFYYFSTSVHIILGIILAIVGYLIQKHTYKEMIKKEIR